MVRAPRLNDNAELSEKIPAPSNAEPDSIAQTKIQWSLPIWEMVLGCRQVANLPYFEITFSAP